MVALRRGWGAEEISFSENKCPSSIIHNRSFEKFFSFTLYEGIISTEEYLMRCWVYIYWIYGGLSVMWLLG